MSSTAPWEQQPNEGSRAYEAFRFYRDQTPSERSQRQVAAALGKSGALIARWSAAHAWVDRASAWDAEQDRRWQADLSVKRRQAVDRHLNITRAAQGKIAQRLMDLDARTLSVTELTRLLDVVTRVERDALTLGQPSRVEVSGLAGDPVSVHVAAFTAMGDEQRRLATEDMIATVQRRLQATAGVDDDD